MSTVTLFQLQLVGHFQADQLENAQQAVTQDPYFAIGRKTMPALANGPVVSGVSW